MTSAAADPTYPGYDYPGYQPRRTYEVSFWAVRKLTQRGRVRWRARWRVGGREHHKSFTTRALADGFLTDLKTDARRGRPFDPATGLPVPTAAETAKLTWYAHARGYAATKWPRLAANSRRSLAEALTTITTALLQPRPGAPDPDVLRRALFSWAFNPATHDSRPPRPVAHALDWAAAASLPLTALGDPPVIRRALDACARTLTGAPAAATTVARKRAILHNALGYAVEAGIFPTNPTGRVQWTAPDIAESIDRRVVANPTQAAALLAAVAAQGDRGRHLQAFFGCLYYAGLRPGEAVALTEADLHLPESGWGHINLARSAPKAGRAWTDTGTARDHRGLKHRARNATRTIPIPPELITLLRNHLARYGTTGDGRLFRTNRGGHIQDTAYGHVWHTARELALSPSQAASPLARRPYDLRHAAVSLWLNAGVPPSEVARRAGHSIHVLLRVYANCLDGHTGTDNTRISDALNPNSAGLSSPT